jgi:hypothetical protein
MTQSINHPAHFDSDTAAVVIERLTIADSEVVREAQRWGTGERGPLVDDHDALADADLTNFVTEAVRIGALALNATGQAQEARAFEQMLKEVGDKTASSTANAADLIARTVRDASEVVASSASSAKTAITQAEARNRQELAAAVKAAQQDLNAELRRLFAGEKPELIDRLGPVLEKFGTDLDLKANAGIADLMANAAKQFDPADPTSPMARHMGTLTARQEQLTAQLGKQHAELANRIEQLSTMVRVQEATAALTQMTPLKGDSYADAVNRALTGIAVGLGGEYTNTSATTGHLPRCKKGDGVLSLDDGAARVVIEMSDSVRAGWGDYLDEAERNRDAAASLGLVRSADQNDGQTLRVIGSRRLVMAFDPDSDSPDLLRTVLLLLRTTAFAAVSRNGVPEVTTAEEKIAEALLQLVKLDKVKKASAAVQKSAAVIDTECTALNSGVRRLLDEALIALAGAQAAGRVSAGAAESHQAR